LSVSSSHEFVPLVLRSRRFFGKISYFFFGGEGKIPPERPRINTGQSGGSGDGSPPVRSRGKATVEGLGDEVPRS